MNCQNKYTFSYQKITSYVFLVVFKLSKTLSVLLSPSVANWSYSFYSTVLHDTQIDSLTTTHGFKQIISDPTHILPQASSCIDLITDQPNYVIDCGTHPSLHPSCHHQITFCKLNLKVEYSPPPYECPVWNFKKSNNDFIKKAIELVN